jgi:predicted  nucleic acid-binding Zn ribbon protein
MLDGTQANDFEKVQIAGHYHFSEELTADLISRLESNLRKKGIDLEKVVTTQIRTAIDRYLYAFGYYE